MTTFRESKWIGITAALLCTAPLAAQCNDDENRDRARERIVESTSASDRTAVLAVHQRFFEALERCDAKRAMHCLRGCDGKDEKGEVRGDPSDPTIPKRSASPSANTYRQKDRSERNGDITMIVAQPDGSLERSTGPKAAKRWIHGLCGKDSSASDKSTPMKSKSFDVSNVRALGENGTWLVVSNVSCTRGDAKADTYYCTMMITRCDDSAEKRIDDSNGERQTMPSAGYKICHVHMSPVEPRNGAVTRDTRQAMPSDKMKARTESDPGDR